MGLTWNKKLTLDTLEDFATEHVKPAYLMAYKALLSEPLASGLAVDALSRVFSLRESYEESAEDIAPEKAIADAMEPLLSKTQLANFHNTSITTDENALPSTEALIEMVDRVVDKARAEMPRYAPVFSGTTATAVILAMVAIIVAAIAFICTFPSGSADNDVSADTTIMVESNSRLDPDYMVALDAEIQQTDRLGFEFNTGAIPLTVELSGPDKYNTESLSAANVTSGSSIGLYQYDKNSYCCIASSDGLYLISAQSNDGHTAYSYINVLDVLSTATSATDVHPVDRCAVVSHGQQTTIELFDSRQFNEYTVLSSDDTVSLSDLSLGEIRIIAPQYGSLKMNSNMTAIEYSADDHAGIESITVICRTKAGKLFNFTMPLIISNYAPIIDTDSLSLSLVHTPSNAGTGAGRLYASDKDGDEVTFELVSAANCSVMLAPNGGYLVSIDRDYSGTTASFSFTVTDGLITSDIETVTITLENHTIDQLEYTQDFICYGGDYFYTFDLPEYDIDGDALTWTVISTMQDGLTPNGSRIMTGTDSPLKYQISPDLNEDTVEVISLICSDGWLQSPTVTLACIIHENKPPVADSGNRISIPLDQAEVSCTLSIKDDFELDKCVIDSVYRAVGGSVRENEGWDDLVFTFCPDGTETDCYVILTVRDVLTGNTSNIRYTITRS